MLADKAIFRSNPDGLQGKATQYASKKAVQAVCNAYENGFSSVRTGVGATAFSLGLAKKEMIDALLATI